MRPPVISVSACVMPGSDRARENRAPAFEVKIAGPLRQAGIRANEERPLDGSLHNILSNVQSRQPCPAEGRTQRIHMSNEA